jgi:hypothetical protein
MHIPQLNLFYNTNSLNSRIVNCLMNKRPDLVTAIGFVFIAVGVIEIVYHLFGFKTWHPFQTDVLWVCLVNLIAVVCGIYVLRGRNWARWLTVIWIAYHVILSSFHSLGKLAVHGILFAVFAYFLFRPSVSQFFRGVENRAGGKTH